MENEQKGRQTHGITGKVADSCRDLVQRRWIRDDTKSLNGFHQTLAQRLTPNHDHKKYTKTTLIRQGGWNAGGENRTFNGAAQSKLRFLRTMEQQRRM
jgi:hypothetical protein